MATIEEVRNGYEKLLQSCGDEVMGLESELAALRERVAMLEAHLQKSRWWLRGIHATINKDESGTLFTNCWEKNDVTRLEAFLNGS